MSGSARLDGDLIGYDGLHDPGLTAVLLEAMAGGESIGPLRFARRPGAQIDTGLESLVLTAEQSNTSLLFGEEAILKVFRRLSPGPNPDLEVPDALARMGSQHVAAPLGWITAQTQGLPTVLAVLSSYLRNAVDGWSLAATSVRDLYATGTTNAAQAGGDFSGEAHRLGEATAEVHRDLAVAFGTQELPARAYRDMSAQMLDRLDRAAAAVPGLARHDRAAADRVRGGGHAHRPARGAADPRRLPPGPGDAHPHRVGAARLRGGARGSAGATPGLLPRTARRGRHAALPRLRRALPARRARERPSWSPRRPGTGRGATRPRSAPVTPGPAGQIRESMRSWYAPSPSTRRSTK